MKITRDEFKRSEEKSALELFRQGIKADETREKYTRTLKRILCVILEDFFEGSFDQRANQLVKMAKETGGGILLFSPIEGIILEEQNRQVTYFDKMEDNLENLKIALECS